MAAEPALVVRDVEGPAAMAACIGLYAEVMGLRPSDGGLNPRLLTAIQSNGGIVVAAYEGDGDPARPVGFAYSFLAREGGGELFQFSQLAVVARHLQGQGVGRLLKHAQRERALAMGLTRIRWSYDPLKTRNAHFNLDVLGGRVRVLKPSMYGGEGFGDDAGEPTDRFLLDWDLTRPAMVQPGLPERAWRPGERLAHGDDLLIAVPARWDLHRTVIGAAAAAALRTSLRETFIEALTTHVGVSCLRVTDDLAVYRFVPRGTDQEGAS
ncbi:MULTISPECIES: hypothetical protein [unclassified Streptomyces]|uniref:hypothetical protein n=1 Tax=unclassified Streptomyces TaxID=2593676 RepID=UPI000B82635E|nr:MULTISPECIES: hypothetical protein [unclassified Streptomyces]MDX2730600.1 hypothetical protein [Streptomyces sp. PA03-2a]